MNEVRGKHPKQWKGWLVLQGMTRISAEYVLMHKLSSYGCRHICTHIHTDTDTRVRVRTEGLTEETQAANSEFF